MTREEFLERVYARVSPGMEIRKPTRISRVLAVTPSGSIYYSIGARNRKAVMRRDLEALYVELDAGRLTNAGLRAIAGTARPCNVSTMRWLLPACGLAAEAPDGSWTRTW